MTDVPPPPSPEPQGQPPYAGGPTPPTQPPAPQQPYSQQPYGQANAYGTPAAYPGGAYTPVAGGRTNTLAIVSLICSLGGLIIWFLAPVAGIITGHIALAQIKRTGEQGRGLALAGTIVGYCLAGLTVVFVVIYVIVIVTIVAGVGAACTADPTSCS